MEIKCDEIAWEIDGTVTINNKQVAARIEFRTISKMLNETDNDIIEKQLFAVYFVNNEKISKTKFDALNFVRF